MSRPAEQIAADLEAYIAGYESVKIAGYRGPDPHDLELKREAAEALRRIDAENVHALAGWRQLYDDECAGRIECEAACREVIAILEAYAPGWSKDTALKRDALSAARKGIGE